MTSLKPLPVAVGPSRISCLSIKMVRSGRLAEKERVLQEQYNKTVFSLVLHGHGSKYVAALYATKFLETVNDLHTQYPGSLVVVYFDQSTPKAFLERVAQPNVILVFVRQKVPSSSVMLARFREFAMRRQGKQFVFTFDGHEDLGEAHNFRYMVSQMYNNPQLHAGALFWNEHDVTPVNGKRPPRLFPKRKPARVLDAGGMGVNLDALTIDRATFLQMLQTSLAYSYGFDEVLLDKWFQEICPKWWTMPKCAVVLREGDPESDITIRRKRIAPDPVGDHAEAFADEIVDWHSEGALSHELHQCRPIWNGRK